jgi:hypothetical protein
MRLFSFVLLIFQLLTINAFAAGSDLLPLNAPVFG